MKKLLVIILVLASVLSVSSFAPIGKTLTQATETDKAVSASIVALPSLFPTNATFETKAEVIGNTSVASIGGSQGSSYYAQSFEALSDYIVNGGLWLEKYSTPTLTPNFRLMLCNNTASGSPNIAKPMAFSQNITGTTIDTRPGRFYLNLTKPIRVQQNQTYWLAIDGYMDNATNGKAQSRWTYGNPYKDGGFLFSNNAGVSWGNAYFASYDLDFVVNFTSRPNKAEVFGTDWVTSVGGQSGSDYYAQSFKALDSYVVDAGIWIENASEPTPNFRVQIWANNATGYPDKNNVIASSRVIKGSEINETQGQRFFVHPNVTIPVVKGEIYWLVIDGYYDQASAGSVGSRGISVDLYKDGEFLYSNDVGSTWHTWSIEDLNFIATFSASQSAIKMMKGDSVWQGIGGNGGYNYAGQSFRALNKYILDAGVWLQNWTYACPTTRLLICPPTAGNASQPDLAHPIAKSVPITGLQISSNPGMQYLKPTKPIAVVPGQTYFFIIDGYSLGNATAGSLRTYDRNGNPYTDGVEMYSTNAGATWGYFASYDLGLDVSFSDIPYEVQDGKNNNIAAVGGTATTPYYAQSFIALNDYIADAGVSIIPKQAPTPDFQLLLCGNNATGSDHPNLNNVLTKSLVIRGTTIDANPGLFYVKPSAPIPVQRFQKYWIVIDGLTYNASSGQAQSEAVNYDVYPDGEFLWAYPNLALGWFNGIPYGAYDLHFDVTFTHLNQPPTQPPVLISPLKPFDADDLYAYMPYGSTDLEQNPIAYYVEWYKNGIPQPAWANLNTLPKGATNATDDWTAKITPYDGHINGTAGTYTVHVQADILTIDHPVTADSQTFHILTTSNTTITSFTFYPSIQGQFANITFTSTGSGGAIGFCNITIPKSLMAGPWAIRVNGILVDPPKTENATHTTIQLEYATSSVPVIIQGIYAVPEFTPALLLVALAITTLAITIVVKKINKRKQ